MLYRGSIHSFIVLEIELLSLNIFIAEDILKSFDLEAMLSRRLLIIVIPCRTSCLLQDISEEVVYDIDYESWRRQKPDKVF